MADIKPPLNKERKQRAPTRVRCAHLPRSMKLVLAWRSGIAGLMTRALHDDTVLVKEKNATSRVVRNKLQRIR